MVRPAWNRHRREKIAKASGLRKEPGRQFWWEALLFWLAFTSLPFLLVEANLTSVPGILPVFCDFSKAIFHQFTHLSRSSAPPITLAPFSQDTQ